MDSPLATLTVTSLNHVTKVLSPAFDADTLFYVVNVTSLTYSVDASASSDAATGLNINWKAARAIYTVHSTAPAYQENRVLVSARDTTTTTYVCTPSFSQFCVIVTLVPVMLSTAPVCVHEVVRSSFNARCPGSVPCHNREVVRHGIRLGMCVQRYVRWPKLQRAKLSPLSSAFFELGETQTSTLSGRASVRARGREPDVTGIPSAPLEPSPFMIRLRHHLSRTTGVLAQHQHRGTVESRRGIRLSVRMWIVFRKRQKANFPLAQDAAAPFLITFFDNCWYEDSGTAESEEFLWTRLQGQPLGHGIGKQC